MKEVIYLPEIRRDAEIAALAERATAQLEEIVRSFAPLISAEWNMIDERGRAEVNLRLADDTGSVMARFQPRELKDPEQMGKRLRWVWDDLLRERFNALQKRLEDKLQQDEGA